ncbi:MAG: DUF1217 domain-containing protein [Pseudomonadota bacterium]
MTFTPAVPASGVLGLTLLDRSYDRQFEAFTQSPAIERAVADFEARAGEITTAEELVQDRGLLEVALGAFGLEDELPKRALIRRVLEEGTLDQRSLANRLVDPAWRRFSETLALDTGGRLAIPSVRREIVDAFRERQFERAVGDQDVNLRLALNFRREIADIAAAPDVERSGWFRVIGSTPLRTVIFGALGLPDSFAAIDVDSQVARLNDRAAQVFGDVSPAVFTDPDVVEDAVRRFLVRGEIEQGPTLNTPGGAALGLLQGGLGPSALTGLLASRFS